MDYHHYNTLGVGSVPQILTGPPQSIGGNGMQEPTPGSGPSPQMTGAPSSLLAHHPSLMFHYGVGGKPHNLPHHLMPPVSVAAANIICTSGNSISSISINSAPLVYTKASGLGGRATATVPPLALGVSSHAPLTTSAGSARPTSPNSSFAAALRSLAKQATVPAGGSDVESHHLDSSHRSSPKSLLAVTSSSNGPIAVASSAPSVVTMAPSHTHHALSEMRKSVEGGIGLVDMERLGPEDIVRGFQPYRAPDLPTVTSTSQVSLRPTIPIELAHAYQPYPSIYSHHLSHQYRLEEQLYLERYGLLRPPMPPYGVGGLSALYQSASPYLSPRFTPELLPTSLAALHPSSALLHERLKLEEDIRQREYELELRRERELERERDRERERERERGREREREREREKEKERELRRHKEQQETERCKEERHKNLENARDRSPVSHGTPSIANWNVAVSDSTGSSGTLTTSSSFSKKSHQSGSVTQPSARSSDSRSSAKHHNENVSLNSTNHLSKSSNDSPLIKFESTVSNSSSKNNLKHRVPAIVRPFESTPSAPTTSVSYSGPIHVGTVSHAPHGNEEISVADKDGEPKVYKSPHKKSNSGTESCSEVSKPFSVWQPVKLTASEPENLSSCKVQSTVEGSITPVCQPVMTTVASTLSQSITDPSATTANSYLISASQASSLQPSSVTQSVPLTLTPHSTVSFSHFPSFISDPHHLPHSIATTLPQTTSLAATSFTQSNQNCNSASGTQLSFLPHSQPYGMIHSSVVTSVCKPQVTKNTAGQLNSPYLIGQSIPVTNLSSIPPTKSLQLHQPFFTQISETLQSTSPSSVCVNVITLPSEQENSSQSSSQIKAHSDALPTATPPPTSSPDTVISSSISSDILNSTSKELSLNDSLSPVEKPEPVVISRLDIEEQRFRDLIASGMYAAEAEETLLEEALCQNGTPGFLCKSGPSDPYEASTEKLSFLSIFDLTTHNKADEIALDRCERRAKVMTPLVRSSSVDSNSPNGCVSAIELIPKLAPGLNLSDTPKLKSTSSLLVDFSSKSKFLSNLDMQPQYSAAKQRELNRLWKLVIEERLRRYEDSSDNPLEQKIFNALKKLLEPPAPPSSSPIHEKTICPSMPITSSSSISAKVSASSTFNGVEQNTAISSVITLTTDTVASSTSPGEPTFASSHATNCSTPNKTNAGILKIGLKGIMEDGIFGVGSYLAPDADPLLTGLTGFDKMIDHFVKNAQAEGGTDNSALIEHIEDVRRCQVSVCQTAQIVQEQVANLITSRSQLESHRTALHHHLACITNILAAKNSQLCNPTSQSFAGGNVHSTQNPVSQPAASVTMPAKSIIPNHFLSSPMHPIYSLNTVPSTQSSSISVKSMSPNLNAHQQASKLSASASSSMANLHSIPALVSSGTKSSPSILPSTTVMSWAGLQSPFLGSPNIPICLENNDSVFYPHVLSAREYKDSKAQTTTTSTHTKVTSKLVSSCVATNLSKSHNSSRHGSNKGLINSKPQSFSSHNHSTSKFNGSICHVTQQNIFKPVQLTSSSGGANSSSKSYNLLKTNSSGGNLPHIGHSSLSSQEVSHPNQGNSPNTNAFQHNSSKSSLHRPLQNHATNSKQLIPTNKSPVGFAPYSKSSPNKVQTWLPN